MIITIYNILILIMSCIVIVFGTSTTVSIWYAVLCLFGLTFTALFKRVLCMYPKVSYKHREAIETFCGKEYSERLVNNLFSWVAHTFLLLMYANNVSLVIAISGVIAFKLLILVHGHGKVKEELK